MSKSKQKAKRIAKRRAGSPKQRRSVSGGRRFDQAEALYQSGRWEEALKSLDRSIACDNANYDAHANRCRIRFLRGLAELSDRDADLLGKLQPSRVALLVSKITDEPNVPPSRDPEVERLAESAYEALQSGDGLAAEEQLRRAVELDSDAPDLWNNLAMSLMMQDRNREANEILFAVADRWPEYFFGQLALANQLIVEHKLDEAMEVLDRLQHQGEFHRTEFSGLCKPFIKYELARHETRSALKWLEMLENCTPDDINIPSLRRRIGAKPRLRDVFGAGTSGW